jgi:hypothetical protein
MPSRDWIKPLALGLVALTVTLVWASFYVGSQSGEARGERNYHAARYEAHAVNTIRDTFLVGEGGDIAECVAEILNSTNEQKRAENNLVAQTEMARWAFYMLVATVVIAGITGLGVYYVWLTLRATQDMARETTRIGGVQVRAYVGVVNATVTNLKLGEQFRVDFKVQNSGQSPAKQLSVTTVVGLLAGDVNS